MKKNTLTTLGIMVLSITMLASTVTGCGDKETSEVPATELIEATETTEVSEPETELVTEATEAVEPETETEVTEIAEAQEEADYTVKDMSATKYAKQSVNVRKGPSTEFEQLGSLSTNQKVTVTGQADTGWYRIDYNGKVGYVSDKYLSDQKVTASASGTNTNAANNTSTTAPSADTSGNSTNTGTTNTNTGNNTPSTDIGNTNTPSTPSTDTGSTNTPSTPAETPNTPVTPPADNSNSLGTIGGAGTGNGGAFDENGVWTSEDGSTIIVWE
ncbi:MAG: SH3 domain-containing protein [Clostridiales bacterium]|nr:SH3 domain-containing protein [Roseburia sp.]MDD7637055.1 SH3 domain-containing protein [Clostridiales bacterium]MDY4111219.1 SH3 domain-containing protein [Roseburia sp.]